MNHKGPDYVYILTNPSFCEDWVKIGKSIDNDWTLGNIELRDGIIIMEVMKLLDSWETQY